MPVAWFVITVLTVKMAYSDLLQHKIIFIEVSRQLSHKEDMSVVCQNELQMGEVFRYLDENAYF